MSSRRRQRLHRDTVIGNAENQLEAAARFGTTVGKPGERQLHRADAYKIIVDCYKRGYHGHYARMIKDAEWRRKRIQEGYCHEDGSYHFWYYDVHEGRMRDSHHLEKILFKGFTKTCKVKKWEPITGYKTSGFPQLPPTPMSWEVP